MNEIEQKYGKVKEGFHITGYTFERAATDLLWLLQQNRWKECGKGFKDINAFLSSIRVEGDLKLAAEQRQKIAALIKAAQPKVSNRALAKAVGADESTIRADKRRAGNPADSKKNSNKDKKDSAGNPALSGPEVAKLAAKQENKGVKEQERKAEREAFEARRDKGARVADLVAMADSGEKFSVIYADPAWEFHTYSGKGKQRSAERYYDTDSLDAIKALPVGKLAADKCSLFLWCVWPELPGALEVIKAWGFEYKTVGFAWVKMTEKAEWIAPDGDGLHWGMGYWTRANTEVCLLATRGEPKRMDEGVHQIVVAPVGEHSVKPEEVRTRIERLVVGPYLELFARRPSPGWTVWGNELAAPEQPTQEAAE